MTPPKRLIALFTVLVMLTYSAAIAYGTSQTCDADTAAGDAITVTVEVSTCDSTSDTTTFEQRVAHSVRTARHALRAGVNLGKALVRSAAHSAVLVARTAAVAVSALT